MIFKKFRGKLTRDFHLKPLSVSAEQEQRWPDVVRRAVVARGERGDDHAADRPRPAEPRGARILARRHLRRHVRHIEENMLKVQSQIAFFAPDYVHVSINLAIQHQVNALPGALRRAEEGGAAEVAGRRPARRQRRTQVLRGGRGRLPRPTPAGRHSRRY